jgi:two-component system nitrogen regulation response regulator GlnG
LQRVSEGGIDVVLLDIQLPDTNGLAVYCQIHAQDHRLPVIFITVEAGSDTAIEAMKLGAYDYVSKPLERISFRALVSRAIETREIVNTPVAIATEDNPDEHADIFIGRSAPMLEIFKAIGRVASQPVTVLIRGQSGTGKELVARALVQHGDRSDKPFLAVNCAALPETLLESELFGHEKGAFTGADNKRIGKFEQANGGTLFLDEIGDMSPSVQAKVLRVLQEQRFQRVGGTKELVTDARVIAATNRNLERMVEEGDFREDLVYRLNTVTIPLPLLKDRSEDIPLLLQYFLNRTCKDLGKDELEGISPEATEILKSYEWPGNVRQLNAVVRWMVLNAPAPVISPAMLPLEILERTGHTPTPAAANESPAAVSAEAAGAESHREIDLIALVERLLEQGSTNVYAETLEQMERYVLTRVLDACGGNQTQAAEVLGITRGKIRDRMATYDLKR